MGCLRRSGVEKTFSKFNWAEPTGSNPGDTGNFQFFQNASELAEALATTDFMTDEYEDPGEQYTRN